MTEGSILKIPKGKIVRVKNDSEIPEKEKKRGKPKFLRRLTYRHSQLY